jgi:copper transport protein
VDLVSSDPSDGKVLAGPPPHIALVFSTDAEPAGDGIVLVDAAGAPVAANVEQTSPDGVVVTPVRTLGSGTYSVVWTMRAGDAHPRSGSTTFRVDTAAPASGPAVSADPAGENEVAVGGLTPAIGEPSTTTGDWLGRLGRSAALLGALMGIGALTFAATSLVGRRREVQEAGFWVRRGGVLVIIGTLVEAGGASMALQGAALEGLTPTALWEVMAGTFGVALLLRLVGGAAMVKGTGLRAIETSVQNLDPPAVSGPQRSAGPTTLVRERTEPTFRLDLSDSVPAMIGVAVVAASYLFDGHTVTASPTIVVRISSIAHVLAAGVWVGGVVLMAQTLTIRWRGGRELQAAPLAIRFSRVASAALVVVGAAGLALAWSILDGPGELLSTAWGRVLLVKLGAVGVAAALGAHNHFVVLPALERAEHDEDAADRLRRTVTIEGAVLLLVVLTTAILVGAAS